MTAAVKARPRAAASPASKQRLRLWLRMLRATRAIEAELRERLRLEFSLTLPQFDVLAALARRDGSITMTELSRMLIVSNGNVTGIVDRLEADGLVARRPVAGDRRAMLARLTSQGEAEFARLAAEHEAWVDELLGTVSAAEADQLIARLQAVRDRLAERRMGG